VLVVGLDRAVIDAADAPTTPARGTSTRTKRTAGVNRVLRASPVQDTDRTIAERAATSLEDHRLDSCYAVDALVVATAVAYAPVVILTADADDLTRLVGASRGVVVQALP
jgi:hypothetical protein